MDWMQLLREISMDNVIQVFILGVFVVIAMAGYTRVYFATSIELLFMKQKESKKKDIYIALIFFFLCTLINVILSNNNMTLFIDILLAIGTLLFMLIYRLIVFFSKKEDKRNIILWCQYIEIVVGIPIIIGFVTINKQINLVTTAIMSSIVETIFILFLFHGFKSETSIIMLSCNNEKYYVYGKIGDGYLLCGEKNKMSDAQKIFLVDINDIYSKKYFFVMDKKKGKESNNEE